MSAAMISIDNTRAPFLKGKASYRSNGLKGYTIPSTGQSLEGSGSGDAGQEIWKPAMEAYLQGKAMQSFNAPPPDLVSSRGYSDFRNGLPGDRPGEDDEDENEDMDEDDDDDDDYDGAGRRHSPLGSGAVGAWVVFGFMFGGLGVGLEFPGLFFARVRNAYLHQCIFLAVWFFSAAPSRSYCILQ